MKNKSQKLPDQERAALLTEINAAYEGSPFNIESASIVVQDLPFYPGYRFVDVTDYEESAAAKHGYFIYKPGTVYPIDWTSKVFYALAAQNFVLNSATAPLYLYFFFKYVRGDQGRFIPIETIDDMPWREEPSQDVRRAIADLICPITVLGQDDQGDFVLELCVLFKNTLFKSIVTVTSQGHTHLSDSEILIEDLPVLDDILG